MILCLANIQDSTQTWIQAGAHLPTANGIPSCKWSSRTASTLRGCCSAWGKLVTVAILVLGTLKTSYSVEAEYKSFCVGLCGSNYMKCPEQANPWPESRVAVRARKGTDSQQMALPGDEYSGHRLRRLPNSETMLDMWSSRPEQP